VVTPPDDAAIRVLVADDHALIRRGLCDMLGLSPRIRVVAEGQTGDDAVRLFRTHRPDVAILDLRMPGLGGVEAMQTIRSEFPDARLIALSSYTGDTDVHRALSAGALSFLFKTVLADDLIATVLAAHAGQRRLSPEVVRLLEQREGEPELTDREVEVLQLLARGRQNEEVATALGITVETVKVHVRRILGKLGAINRTQAVATGLERGIVRLE
jgi:two-component system, NarL family, response regulator